MFWVAVENVIVSGSWRTAPQVCRVKSPFLDISQVFDQNSMVSGRAVTLGFEVLHRVQIRYVDSSLVWRRAVMSILVNIESE